MIETTPGLAEWAPGCDVRGQGRIEEREAWRQDAPVRLREEDRNPPAQWSQPVALAPGNPHDQVWFTRNGLKVTPGVFWLQPQLFKR